MIPNNASVGKSSRIVSVRAQPNLRQLRRYLGYLLTSYDVKIAK